MATPKVLHFYVPGTAGQYCNNPSASYTTPFIEKCTCKSCLRKLVRNEGPRKSTRAYAQYIKVSNLGLFKELSIER